MRIRLDLVMTIFVGAFLSLSLAEGGENISASNRSNSISHPFLAADYFGNRMVRVDAEGAVLWSYEAPHPQDVWLLPNGNVLFCHQLGAKIAAPDLTYHIRRQKDPKAKDRTKIVWEFKTEKPNEVHSCQPLANGGVLVGVSSKSPVLLEMNAKGKIVKTIAIQTNQQKIHSQMRGVRKTKAGTYLVGQNKEGLVREYNASGKVIREIPLKGSNPYLAIRLDDGNTLIACGDGNRIVEIDPAGKIVWQLRKDDIPGNPLCFVAGLQLLPNGNLVICNYSGGNHGEAGAQPQIFEITGDKRLVWQFDEYPRFQHFTHVQLLDIPGNVVTGEIVR